MKELIFASANENKAMEIKGMLPATWSLLSLNDLGYTQAIEETEDTFQGNALIKAKTIFEQFKLPCFADDSGLEVDALNGLPGVHSARYAGPNRNDIQNTNKLLEALLNQSNRKAQFKTVIAFYDGLDAHFFEGKVEGHIGFEPKGSQGFGYDPIFIPDGWSLTFAEVDKSKKSECSHRARAFSLFMNFLEFGDKK